MKWLVPHLLLLMACMAVVPCAGAQIVSPQTSDDLVVDAVDTTTEAVADRTQSVPVGGLTTPLADAVSTTQQTATGAVDGGAAVADTSGSSTSSSGSTSGTSGGSTSSSRHRSGGRASPGKEFRSRFDRLPPRLERLLERIELGRNLRANLRRLQEALASLSASERARVIRLLNAEIRHLRANGVSPAERRRIARLLRAREHITALGTPTATPLGAPTATPATVDAGTPIPTTRPKLAGGVLGASVSGRDTPSGQTAPSTIAGSSEPSGIPEAGGFPLKIVLALGAVLLVVLGGLAVKEEWLA